MIAGGQMNFGSGFIRALANIPLTHDIVIDDIKEYDSLSGTLAAGYAYSDSFNVIAYFTIKNDITYKNSDVPSNRFGISAESAIAPSTYLVVSVDTAVADQNTDIGTISLTSQANVGVTYHF